MSIISWKLIFDLSKDLYFWNARTCAITFNIEILIRNPFTLTNMK